MTTSGGDRRLTSLGIRDPLVTVIVTSYNYGKYIIESLRSVLRQTYPYYKCIVVDDCSQDNSVELIEEFMRSDEAQGRFSLVRHEQNSGQMAAFKTGLNHAEGVFVVLLDADDLLFEDFLLTHVRAHCGPQPVAFTSSNQYQINENNELIAGSHPDLQAKGEFRYVKPSPILDPFWVWATTSSMMFRRSVLEMIIPDDCEPFRICADNYISHFGNLLGGSILIPTIHGCYRRHGANYFSDNPFVGGRLPTGDMSRHPKHQVVRTGMLSHFLKNQDKFYSLLSEGPFISTLLRAARPHELLRIRKNCPVCFAKRTILFFCAVIAASTVFRALNMLRKTLSTEDPGKRYLKALH